MQVAPSAKRITGDPAADGLKRALLARDGDLSLGQALFHYDYPVHRSPEGELILSKALLVSRNHGVVFFWTVSEAAKDKLTVERASQGLDRIFNAVYSKLIAIKGLKKSRTELSFPVAGYIYAPTCPTPRPAEDWVGEGDLERVLQPLEHPIPPDQFCEIVSVVEGAKGLPLPKERAVESLPERSKGRLASTLETEILNFDNDQKHGFSVAINGPHRIRGLAGSGKTVVLAMQAAQVALRNERAQILYTFHTKSLYQHVKRLITRFYRQFHDTDPDWSRIHVQHSWGGSAFGGTYYNACRRAGIPSVPYRVAVQQSPDAPFDYACGELLKYADRVEAAYDYIFIDEGQDFPPNFIKLCDRLVRDGRFVLAYDQFQTIFQTTVPDLDSILGQGRKLEEDIVLHKCYRNTREILVCAHAIGLGAYGGKMVQILENEAHWNDVGYKLVEGPFKPGQTVKLTRPLEYSTRTISENQSADEIVRAFSFDSFADEVKEISRLVKADIDDGLRPEDIMIVVADDRNAKTYCAEISVRLAQHNVLSNDTHGSPVTTKFQQDGMVTLTTVHKAKGNEAFSVYVVGADHPFALPDVRSRNLVFTAMTRAKAWLCISGVGLSASALKSEVDAAKAALPYLTFEYPDPSQIQVMRRDLAVSASRKLRQERLMEQLAAEGASPEEIKAYFERRRPKTADEPDDGEEDA